jgi:hypothetical protein
MQVLEIAGDLLAIAIAMHHQAAPHLPHIANGVLSVDIAAANVPESISLIQSLAHRLHVVRISGVGVKSWPI